MTTEYKNVPKLGHVQSLSEIKITPIKYLWKPYLPDRAVNILGGIANTGKSTFAARLMADLAKGEEDPPEGMPSSLDYGHYGVCGAGGDCAHCRSVGECERPTNYGRTLYLGGEDDNMLMAEKVLRYEVSAEQFDLIKFNDDPVPADHPDFIPWVASFRPRLVIVDPIASYMPKDRSMNNSVDARFFCQRLTTLARQLDCCVLLVMHPSKDNARDLVSRLSGSMEWVNAARSVIYLSPHPTERNHVVGYQAKSNRGWAPPFVASIDPAGMDWRGIDKSITRRMVEAAERQEGGLDHREQEFLKVLDDLLKVHTDSDDISFRTLHQRQAREIAELYKAKVLNKYIDHYSLGRHLCGEDFRNYARRKGDIMILSGKRTGNRQHYIITKVSKAQEEKKDK